jgi:predicted solute-binding protein
LNPILKPRVCAVSYLNTVPLVWGMLHGDQRDLFDLEFSIPSECADRLADGRADIGIVPCIELSRQRLDIIRGAGIACHGAVRSILLISKVPFHQIRTLAVDSSSRTSVMLSRIVLARKYGAYPEIRAQRPDLAEMLDFEDACLIIGDPALLLDPADMPFHVLDLGAEWMDITGLPMVFAVWAQRAGLPPQDPQPFLQSLRFGKDRLEEIVRSEYTRRGITAELAREYLTRYIVFELGDREYQGLSLFLQYAAELPSSIELRKVSV